jgi:methylmalonyl-CoA mutase
MQEVKIYQPKNKIRIATAASLFDGHDASINIMRRILQSSGVEVIHLGHNRSVKEIVDCAIQEDVQAIAITSYQGGHVEFFKYMYDLLHENGCGHIKLFGGGGGTILPTEIEELHTYGITRIYSPDDGRSMGLQGMINDLLSQCDFPTGKDIKVDIDSLTIDNHHAIAQLISCAENDPETFSNLPLKKSKEQPSKTIPVIGITGTGGAGKSSLVDELLLRIKEDLPQINVGIISIDPTKRTSGGALLGDRIRMNALNDGKFYMRSMATRAANASISKNIQQAITVLKTAGFDWIIIETSGIGQSGSEIVDIADINLYVMTPEYGAPSQLEKIDMIDLADLIAINKFDKKGSQDALRDVRKQYKRSRNLWEAKDEEIPVFGTMASQMNNQGLNLLYQALVEKVSAFSKVKYEGKLSWGELLNPDDYIIPPNRQRYLSEIVENNRKYNQWADKQTHFANTLQGLKLSLNILSKSNNDSNLIEAINKEIEKSKGNLDKEHLVLLENWEEKKALYKQDNFIYKIRDKEIKTPLFSISLSQNKIPKIVLPHYSGWGDIVKWYLQENVPGEFPYTAGVFPFKRKDEDLTRMFAGEGGPERTNKRFHYLSKGMPGKRLSTAFDSVTLYGNDPNIRPDIFGKIGNSGVSICCLDDAKKLYSGFDLVDPNTSVSMTINGPASIITAFFFNAAIDQQCEKYIIQNGLEEEVEKKMKEYFMAKGVEQPKYRGQIPENNDGLGLMLLGITGDKVLPLEVYEKIKADTLSKVRGTVQADILKEDQAQNTCIFSTAFSLKLMGDMQSYFIDRKVRNFYSVSISGYHMAEAGANPISQLAFTLANGFTFIEYYLSRGMHIDDFAPNLSFFFSNGIDPEYAVIGRVARKIWAKALKHKYNGNDRSQKLKYHVQTSGRSLHAQEIGFNDIRTTLQALYAIYDNCNSLHTNAYDEAITTPTEESVRRAVAIQLIINHELGLNKNENPLQGAFIIEELTDLVEEAVYAEFDRITERGGVLGAMETMYQRNKIQEESMHYEMLKLNGEYPIIGVNTFLSSEGSPTIIPDHVIRSSEEEKQYQLSTVEWIKVVNKDKIEEILQNLKLKVIQKENIFEELMEVAKECSLGQISHALFEVGGEYRRNL